MKNRKLPESLEIAGLKHYIIEDDKRLEASGYISKGSTDEQEIVILSTLPFSRRVACLMAEAGHLMLLAAGVPGVRAQKLCTPFGRGLFLLVKDNSFDWLYNADGAPTEQKIPTSIRVCGLRYIIKGNADRHLEDRNLIGEINYQELAINVQSTLPFHSAALVLCHEIAHGLLYEGGLNHEANSEKLIEPLGFFLYQFFKTNDFSFAYAPGGILYDN